METIRVTFAFPVGTSPQKMAFVLRNYADLYDPRMTENVELGTVAVSNPRPTDTAKKMSKSEAKRIEALQARERDEAKEDPFPEETVKNEVDDFEDAFAEPPPKEKKSKTKKIKIDDVIAACKERASGNRYKEVVEILKTKFKVKSVHELTEEQWPVCIKAMA